MTNVDKAARRVSLSVKALEMADDKEAIEKFGSSDSGASLGDILGAALRDVLLTPDEYRAMADGLADTDGPATGETALSRWIIDHRDTLGRGYANELTRHFR